MAINHDAALGIGGEAIEGLGQSAEREPLVAYNLTNLEFLFLAAIDETRALLRRKLNPARNLGGADFDVGSGIG